MRTLKIGVQWLAIARWQQSIERIIETDPLATPGEFAEELSVSHSTVIMHLKQIGMVKSLINGCLISWPKKKKNHYLHVLSSLILQQQWTISWLDCDMRRKVDFIWWPATTNSVVEPRRSSEVLPKAKLAPKKGHCHCLVICWCSEPLQLSESWWNHYIWEVCSADWWHAPNAYSQSWSRERVQFSLTVAYCVLYNQRFRSWMTWVMKFCLIHHTHLISCQLTATSSSILTTFFAGKMLPQRPAGRKCFPRVRWIQKPGFLSYQNKPTFFCWQKCIDWNDFSFD